jgi:hypothetical protein
MEGSFLLADYRAWLESELKLLGNASHHAYSFGQANMAKRAIEKLDEILASNVVLTLLHHDAGAVTTELAALEMAGTLPPGLRAVRAALAAAEVPKDGAERA